MNYLYIDFETYYKKGVVSLKTMTLQEYLAHPLMRVTSLCYALNDEEPVVILGSPTDEQITHLTALGQREDVTFVAHNAAFDLRVWNRLLEIPWPEHAQCSMELAFAAFPNHPGGHGLDNLSRTLNIGAKLEINLSEGQHTEEEERAYVANDVVLCRALHQLCLPRLSKSEITISEMCNALRELHFEIDQDAVAAAAEGFDSIIGESVESLIEVLGPEAKRVFGRDGNKIKSVKPAPMKALLASVAGFNTDTISQKKLNPEDLRSKPLASRALENTSAANKALFHRRNAAKFAGRGRVDVELCYFRAHTGRYSSAQPGCKGVNLHNMPKHDKRVAKALRSMFRLPEGYCWVSVDLANIEYRMEGWLTRCETVRQMFEDNVLTDPYLSFGYAATGIWFKKTDPIRQVFKAAVLGLGYGMMHKTFILSLLKTIASPFIDLSLEDMQDIVAAQRWSRPRGKYASRIQKETSAPDAVMAVAFAMHEAFHRVHPEYKATANWLLEAVEMCNRLANPDRYLKNLYSYPGAPPQERLDLQFAPDLFGPGTKNVRVRCGLWDQPTVTWRDLAIRKDKYDNMSLTMVQEGNKPPKGMTGRLVIENVTQSASRNGMCAGKLKLKDRGWPYIMSVHDEIKIACRTDPEEVCRARQDLIDVYGPGNALGYGWAVSIDPTEVSVSSSMYEDGQDMEWWEEVKNGNKQLLTQLP